MYGSWLVEEVVWAVWRGLNRRHVECREASRKWVEKTDVLCLVQSVKAVWTGTGDWLETGRLSHCSVTVLEGWDLHREQWKS